MVGEIWLPAVSPALRPDFVPFLPLLVPGENACIAKPCSLLCLPKSNNGRSCKCPEGVSSTVLPTGEVKCDCPHGYLTKNNTCVKEGNTALGSGCCRMLRGGCCRCERSARPFGRPLGEEEYGLSSKSAPSCLMPARFCFPFCTRKHVSAEPVQMLQWELHKQHLAV